jgi:hypothetical protein
VIIRFFRENQTSSLFFIPVIAIFLWIYGFLYATPQSTESVMPLYETVLYLTGNIPFINTLLAFILLLGQAFFLNKIIDDYSLLGKRSNMPPLIYVVCMSSLPGVLGLHPVIFVNFLILLACNKLYGTYRREQSVSDIFDSALFLSLATLFYFPAILFFLMLWIYLMVFRTFFWREWVATFIGMLLPYFFVFSYYFWNDTLGYFIISKITFYPVIKIGFFHNLVVNKMILYGLFLILFMVSALRLLRGLPVNTILARKILIANAWMVLFCFLIAMLAGGEVLYTSFIPLSLYFSHYFVSTKKVFLADLLFTILVGFILINQYLG